jgi:hypothetical protein
MLHLHSEHLIHADLKASNVLLTRGTAPIVTAASSAGANSAADLMSPGGLTAQQQQQLQQQELEEYVGGDMSCAALLAAAQSKAGGRLIAKVSCSWWGGLPACPASKLTRCASASADGLCVAENRHHHHHRSEPQPVTKMCSLGVSNALCAVTLCYPVTLLLSAGG